MSPFLSPQSLQEKEIGAAARELAVTQPGVSEEQESLPTLHGRQAVIELG